VLQLASGMERRSTRWSRSRRRWEIGGGLVRRAEAHALLAFFEARGGRLHSFRFQDRLDDRSCAPGESPAATDQMLGTGDGSRVRFPLAKRYSSEAETTIRRITRPEAGSLLVAMDGAPASAAFDAATSEIVLSSAPAAGVAVTAGYRFDAEVRFDVDALDLSIEAFDAVRIGRLSLVEIVR
jgi:uncharacterized protein (TIGR02217 family)